jgi:hypothetical protein
VENVKAKGTEFSMRGQQNAGTAGPSKTVHIHPFLPDISKLLKSEFTGSVYEKLFAGNFVDRVELYDPNDFPREPLWDPLNAKEHTDRRANRRIYCTLVVSTTMVNVLLCKNGFSESIRYYLTLYLDTMIPLVNYIDRLVEKQKKQLETLGFLNIDSVEAIIGELKPFHPPLDNTKIQGLTNIQNYQRFDHFMSIVNSGSIFTDKMLCTQVKQNEPAPAIRYGPSQTLFEKGDIFHDGLLPDVLRHVVNCNFFTESKKNNPLVHLISKALPQRCTIRNLSEILREYCRKHDYVYTFCLSCMKASLLGLYKHATVRPNFHIRKTLINIFNTKSKNEFLQWMLLGHQQLLFYIIKEFLVFGCKLIPSLYCEIQVRYSWDKFEDGVLSAMDAVRAFRHWDLDNPLDFKNVESTLAAENKSQIHNLYRPAKASFASTVITESDRLDEERCITNTHIKISHEWTGLMYQIAIRTKENIIPFDLLKCFQVSDSTIATISQIQEVFNEEGSKTSLKHFLANLERSEFECVRDFCDAYDRRTNIRVFTLPVHTYVEQCKALRRKHRVPHGKPLPDIAGEVMVCLNCKQFKSFINKYNSKGKAENLYAYGHKKVLVEYEFTAQGPRLMTYCGRRCEKSDGKKRHNYSSQQFSSYMDVTEQQIHNQQTERNRKRQSKELRKELSNEVCAKTPLVKVSLIGRILEFYGSLYTICPSCANPMEYNHYFMGKGGFYCGCCLSRNGELYTTISCWYCSAIKHNESWTPVTVRSEDDPEKREQIYLCNGCNKNWTHDTCPLRKSTIRRGLDNKWKKLQHPSNN